MWWLWQNLPLHAMEMASSSSRRLPTDNDDEHLDLVLYCPIGSAAYCNDNWIHNLSKVIKLCQNHRSCHTSIQMYLNSNTRHARVISMETSHNDLPSLFHLPFKSLFHPPFIRNSPIVSKTWKHGKYGNPNQPTMPITLQNY